MALPKNKNIRKIKVDNIDYYWKASHDYSINRIVVRIGLVEKPNIGFKLLSELNDPSLKFVTPESNTTPNTWFGSISPQNIKDSIVFANNNMDWKNTSETILLLKDVKIKSS